MSKTSKIFASVLLGVGALGATLFVKKKHEAKLEEVIREDLSYDRFEDESEK